MDELKRDEGRLGLYVYKDQEMVAAHPELDQATIWVHFTSSHKRYDCVENWGLVRTYG